MIKKGHYKILKIFSISNSLLSQNENENQKSTVQKSILFSEEFGELVVYFIDFDNLGEESEILILNDLNTKLITLKDVKILKYKTYIHDKKFINDLLKK